MDDVDGNTVLAEALKDQVCNWICLITLINTTIRGAIKIGTFVLYTSAVV